ncbi:hypothetical protein J2W40_001736 [Sphingobium xenophagum]|uniref:Uncharacterized protein n=1 Tax=Sphingobium xenophagum TaxID=121428 RepID=A0ABU1X029_SPHXE|nr:hypothetical protein [Sphingobium xenophagum]
MPSTDDDTYSEAETEARRETALKRMLETPHKPHEAMGKPRRAQKPAPSRSLEKDQKQ